MPACNDCDADIRWLKTETGRRMPVNIGRVPGGNVEINDEGIAVVVRVDPLVARHVCHYATCPAAKKAERALANARKAEAARHAAAQGDLFAPRRASK